MDDALLGDLFDRLERVALGGRPEVLLFAALEGEEALAGGFGSEATTPPERAAAIAAAPVGPKLAWLRKVTVRGFRGVGCEATLHLKAQPGLTLVVGRNGSGKSSFAEAVELLLTGSVERWADRQAVWQEGWRNLHHPTGTSIEAGLLVEGQVGTTSVTARWADGAGIDQVTVAGRDELGWAEACSVYRPFLSHAELEAMLGRPSELYDRLSGVLGLEEVPAALKRLADKRKTIDAEVKAPKVNLPGLLADLNASTDPRGPTAAAALAAKKADLDDAERFATGAADTAEDGSLQALRQVARTTLPDVGPLTAALRSAAASLTSLEGTDAERAARTANLLRAALAFHAAHGDQPCPICGAGALDSDWRTAADADASRLESEAASWRDAQRSAVAASEAVRRLPHVPGVTSWEAARNSAGPLDVDQLRRLADDLEEGAGAAQASIDAAGVELAGREDVWSPLAARVLAYVTMRRRADALDGDLKAAKAAETWLKDAHHDLRNRRLEPIASGAAKVWGLLRQESNVELGGLQLTGTQGYRRAVEVAVTVDGDASAGLAVMSQGEVNALALSIFIPRATLPGSPFGFLVIDDPVQAMDPAKVDGLAQVLAEVARTRQVIVFTHDDRLPEAIRRLRLDARVLEVTRRSRSVVDLREAESPWKRAISDARALCKDTGMNDHVAGKVVPVFLRSAIESLATDHIRSIRLGRGDRHVDVETALERAAGLRARLSLALFDDADRHGEVGDEVKRLSGRHDASATVTLVNRGAHGHSIAEYNNLVDSTEALCVALNRAWP
ncbi:MAG: AAA family ATPase [Acidimicrobiales bacterium]